jgi:hypothetical protein
MASDELVTLLVRLVATPADDEARRRAAELLEQREMRAEALAVLAPVVNVTGHEDGSPLPCLCKTCVAGAGLEADASGVGFTRAFAVHGTRVLHYWLIDERGPRRAEVRRAVGDALRGRLRRKQRRTA